MGLKLQSDDSTDNSRWEWESDQTTNSRDTNYSTDEEEDEEDDFSDLEEDTVFIANRYNNNNSYNTVSDTTASSSTLSSGKVPYVFFFLHIALFLGGFLIMTLSLSKLNQPLFAVGRIMVMVGEILAVVDAIIMKVKGYSVSLIILAIVFAPAYWFKRCRENGDSNGLAWITLLIFIGLVGLYVKNTYDMVYSASEEQNAQQTVTYVDQYGNTIAVIQQSTEQEEVNPEKEIADFQRRFYSENGHTYPIGQIIKDNIQDPEFTYVPADGRYQAVPYVEVTGRTTLYGKDQKIVLSSYLNGNGLRQVKIGSKTYKSNKDLSQILDDMIANTTPDVAW